MEIGTLSVTVLEARGLVEPRDMPYGINPRVIVQYDGSSQHTSQVVGQRNPQWGRDANGVETGLGEAFIFSVTDKTFQKPLVAQIFSGSTLLGYAEAHLHDKGVDLGKHRDDWFPVMRPRQGTRGGGRTGNLSDSGAGRGGAGGAGQRIIGSDLRLVLEFSPRFAAQRSGRVVRSGGVEVEDIHASVRKEKKRSLPPSATKDELAEFPTPTQEHLRQQHALREELFEDVKLFFDDF